MIIKSSYPHVQCHGSCHTHDPGGAIVIRGDEDAHSFALSLTGAEAACGASGYRAPRRSLAGPKRLS